MRKGRSITETKERLKELLQKPLGTPYIFIKEIGEGETVVHRMRVELSRIKNNLRKKGHAITKFKIVSKVEPYIEKIKEPPFALQSKTHEKVTLIRVESISDLNTELDELEKLMTGIPAIVQEVRVLPQKDRFNLMSILGKNQDG